MFTLFEIHDKNSIYYLFAEISDPQACTNLELFKMRIVNCNNLYVMIELLPISLEPTPLSPR